MRIAIQGELGSNSHMAVMQMLADPEVLPTDLLATSIASGEELLPCAMSADVFERLEDGSAELAVLPIENSLHGSVFEHYDLLLDSEVLIIGEIMLRVRHNVIAPPGVVLSEVRRVMSHPVALSQCRKWLRQHPLVEAIPFYDTAGSVKELMSSGRKDSAGIAPRLAAEQYGAHVIVEGVEDHAENYTRFYLLAANHAANARQMRALGADKASFAFSLEHRPGSLIEALHVFSAAKINLTKIESRPVPGLPWEYVFFADVRFDNVLHLDEAFRALRQRCRMVKELGRYRSALSEPPK